VCLAAVSAFAAQAVQNPSAARGASEVAAPAGTTPLGDGPWVFDTFEYRIRVVRMAKLVRPWALAWLPDGSMLVTERPGRLRILRSSVLDPQPITGVPTVLATALNGLFDIALHPKFAQNHVVYLTYAKPNDDGSVQPALFRARLEGMALVDGKDILVSNVPIPKTQQQSVAARIIFDKDGMLFMSVGAPNQDRLKAQDPTTQRGKILRLRDDGTPAPGNPFVGKTAFGLPYLPEIYTLGHRNQTGLAFNPETGELWEIENGPSGGDEVNIIRPGHNYGWPYISLGREYDGTPMPPAMEGMDQPVFHWSPNPAVFGLMFYTGDRFPKWKHSVFVGGLIGTRIERVKFNEKWQAVGAKGSLGSEMLLYDLRQRIREVRQGPDGFVYVLTDENDGALLRIEPAQ
jgi:glucose/arabinose dehydrogenase